MWREPSRKLAICAPAIIIVPPGLSRLSQNNLHIRLRFTRLAFAPGGGLTTFWNVLDIYRTSQHRHLLETQYNFVVACTLRSVTFLKCVRYVPRIPTVTPTWNTIYFCDFVPSRYTTWNNIRFYTTSTISSQFYAVISNTTIKLFESSCCFFDTTLLS